MLHIVLLKYLYILNNVSQMCVVIHVLLRELEVTKMNNTDGY